MARRVNSFDGTDGGGQRKYPWHEWIDGSPWEIRQGEDYDVATENMRVNLHMKAKQLHGAVRTRKIADGGVEGLVFQFRPRDGTPGDDVPSGGTPTDADRAALAVLYDDCCHIYETARREVTIRRGDGTTQKYAAIRFKQQMDRAHAEGRLLAAVARTVERRTTGFGHLANAGRVDLMLETFVLDESRPYHDLFDARTLQAARDRMAEYYRARPDQRR